MLNFPENQLCILVVQAGHVFIAKAEGGADGTVRAYNARIIRRWGASKGLGELYGGPTSSTELDAVTPLVLIPVPQIIYALPVPNDTASKWGI